ncbi:hypothetical protein I7I51_06721 [Histoplasma capsulatum]|uniref:Uncharacterized protein n=1 Tax=Ajellomyces capsulatus TaxID=5037 RepID=A0A8A1ML52_AJECA|nr:hypothetical protein I7I51_06721 [Histoplasma capsulatum]
MPRTAAHRLRVMRQDDGKLGHGEVACRMSNQRPRYAIPRYLRQLKWISTIYSLLCHLGLRMRVPKLQLQPELERLSTPCWVHGFWRCTNSFVPTYTLRGDMSKGA